MKRLPCIQQGIIRHWPVRAVGIDADPETHVLRWCLPPGFPSRRCRPVARVSAA